MRNQYKKHAIICNFELIFVAWVLWSFCPFFQNQSNKTKNNTTLVRLADFHSLNLRISWGPCSIVHIVHLVHVLHEGSFALLYLNFISYTVHTLFRLCIVRSCHWSIADYTYLYEIYIFFTDMYDYMYFWLKISITLPYFRASNTVHMYIFNGSFVNFHMFFVLVSISVVTYK
jgi:hypothetical protein